MEDGDIDKTDSLSVENKADKRVFSLFLYEYLEVYEWYLKIEDMYNCSGMCQPALFYFGKDLDQGPPKQTCLKEFKEHITTEIRLFAMMSVLCGVTALFIFLSHCGLYSRPLPADDIDYGQNPHIEEQPDININEIEIRDQNAQVM